MKRSHYAILCNSTSGFRGEAIPAPPPIPSTEVLVRPLWVGICGADLISMQQVGPEGMAFGHERTGIVEQCGAQSYGISVGDLVTSTAFIGCGPCSYCNRRHPGLCHDATILGKTIGTARTWLALPFGALARVCDVPPNAGVLFELAAVAEESLQCILRRLGSNLRLAIIGAGPVGLMVGLTASEECGRPCLVERVTSRQSLSTRLGLNAISPEDFLAISGEQPFSVVVDCSGDSRGG
jgi:threonine dehydrogenase-like Zn-dependent dehydrogenase